MKRNRDTHTVYLFFMNSPMKMNMNASSCYMSPPYSSDYAPWYITTLSLLITDDLSIYSLIDII